MYKQFGICYRGLPHCHLPPECGVNVDQGLKNLKRTRDLKYDAIHILVTFNEFDSSKLSVLYLNLVVRYMWHEKFNLQLLTVSNFLWIFSPYHLLLHVLRWVQYTFFD